MTNKEWLCSLSAEEFYNTWYKVVLTEGKRDIDTRLYMIEWLGKEHIDE